MSDDEKTYSVWICAVCRTQCDPDGHWGCAAKDGRVKDAHGPLVKVDVPAVLIEAALRESEA